MAGYVPHIYTFNRYNTRASRMPEKLTGLENDEKTDSATVGEVHSFHSSIMTNSLTNNYQGSKNPGF